MEAALAIIVFALVSFALGVLAGITIGCECTCNKSEAKLLERAKAAEGRLVAVENHLAAIRQVVNGQPQMVALYAEPEQKE